jgi:hypothetical protein
MPEAGQEETVRVVALDRSFHIACYKCEVSYASEKYNKGGKDINFINNSTVITFL